jgi:DNA replication and repair protein RecF
MRIISAELIGWRNYVHQTFEFDDSPTIFLGSNGQGKTNFVEALVYAALGHSHRTSSDSVLVASGSPEAIIRLSVRHNDRTLAVDLRIASSGANTVRINGTVMKRRDVARLLPLVLFAPEDMDLVRGEPDCRRTFLNDIVSEASASAAGDLADYERVVRQRNTLLKSLRSNPRADLGTLETWTDSVIELATRIMVARRKLVEELDPLVAQHYSAIATSTDVASLSLSESIDAATPDGDIATALRDRFIATRKEELDRGSTLTGPHRDDLLISLNGMPARTHSSQGEAWSCALSLRLANVDLIRRNSVAGDPVVILDDVFSELDAGRRDRLGKHLVGIEHVIITAADLTTIPESLAGTLHRVLNGQIDA